MLSARNATPPPASALLPCRTSARAAPSSSPAGNASPTSLLPLLYHRPARRAAAGWAARWGALPARRVARRRAGSAASVAALAFAGAFASHQFFSSVASLFFVLSFLRPAFPPRAAPVLRCCCMNTRRGGDAGGGAALIGSGSSRCGTHILRLGARATGVAAVACSSAKNSYSSSARC